MASKDMNEEIREIVDDARGSYDLRDRLRGISRRKRVVTVFTDEVVGEELGGVEKVYQPGTKLLLETRRWGVRGEQDELRERAKRLQAEKNPAAEAVAAIKEEAAELQAQAADLEEQLEKSALVFTLQALPELVMKVSKRKAYKNLKLKYNGALTGEEQEDVRDEYLAILLANATVKMHDNLTDTEVGGISVEDAKDLKEQLLPEEWAKLERALDELQAMKAIGDRATDDADF